MPTNEFEGIKQLQKQLDKLSRATAGKALRSANLKASRPALRKAQQSAPVGTRPHKTYKGRLVAPGFLSRSVTRKVVVSKDKTRAYTIIGVKDEAHYGVTFIERGYRVGKRSKKVQRASKRKSGRGGLSDKQLDKLGDKRRKIPARPWLKPAVESKHKEYITLLSKNLKESIRKAIS